MPGTLVLCRWLFGLLAGILLPALCFAGEYGYLQITVKGTNPAHQTNVRLQVGSRPNFAKFSHSLSKPLVQDVTKDVLAKGKSTPITSDYGALQSGCEFDFTIEFSLDRNSWIPLGSYHAPSRSVATSLPIGLCEDVLCSGNARVAKELKRLEDERWARSVEAVRKWLQDAVDRDKEQTRAETQRIKAERDPPPKDDGLNDRIEELRGDVALAETPEPDDASPFTLESEWDARITQAVESGSTERVLADIESQERFYAECLNAGGSTQYYCAHFGGLGWIAATADALAIAYSTDPTAVAEHIRSRVIGADSARKLESAVATAAEAKFRLQAAIDAKRAEERLQSVVSVARTGAAFSPLNDVLDLCELVTGHEFCAPGGRRLGANERLLAAVGVIIGNRAAWEQASGDLRKALFADFKNGESITKAAEAIAAHIDELDANSFRHIFVGEFASAAGYTQIISGMHTHDAVEALLSQWRLEGRTMEIVSTDVRADFLLPRREGMVLKYTDAQGVSVYRFSESVFPKDTFRFNNAVVPGLKEKVRGAKSIFPLTWNNEKIVDALVSVKNTGARVEKDIYRGAVDGVEILVYAPNGKIKTGYPLLK
jgi:hypothetical protein